MENGVEIEIIVLCFSMILSFSNIFYTVLGLSQRNRTCCLFIIWTYGPWPLGSRDGGAVRYA